MFQNAYEGYLKAKFKTIEDVSELNFDLYYEEYMSILLDNAKFDYTTGIEGVYNTIRFGITVLVIGGAIVLSGGSILAVTVPGAAAVMLGIGIYSKIKLKNIEKGSSALDDVIKGTDIDGIPIKSLDDVQARQWYLNKEKTIPDLIDKSLPLQDQAKQAFDLRNHFRTEARQLMSNTELATKLNLTEVNLTWEQVVQKQIAKGFTGDDIYTAIIESSQRSRQSVNQSLGLE